MSSKDKEIMDLQRRIASLEERLNRHSHSWTWRDGVKLNADNLKNLSTSGNYYSRGFYATASVGNQSFTWVWFKPHTVIIYCVASGNNVATSYGFVTSNGGAKLAGFSEGASANAQSVGTSADWANIETFGIAENYDRAIYLDDSSWKVQAEFVSLDDDWFTLNFSTSDFTIYGVFTAFA